MNYERTILELIERVSAMEEKIDLLEQENRNKENLTLSPKKSTRNFTKDDVIRRIREELSKYKITVRKGSNLEGGGLFLKYSDETEKHVLLKLSRNYVPTNLTKFEQFKWRGWHRVVHEDVPSFEHYIFSIEHNGEIDFFIMNQEQYISLTKGKTKDANSNYYFYFVEDLNGNIYEDRDEINDMRLYFNNWGNLVK